MNKTQILKEIWDKWASKQWFKYANGQDNLRSRMVG